MKNVTLFKSWLLLALVMLTGNAMAQTVLLYEDFSKCSPYNGTADSPSGAATYSKDEIKYVMDDWTTVPGWTEVKGYVGDENMKFGTTSAAGSITTPALDLSDENATYTLSFKACAWSGDKNALKVSVDDQEAVEITGLTNAAAPYAANMKEFSLEVKGTAESKITISAYQASKARFFIDDIKVVKLSAGETAEPSLKAPSVVAFGSVKAGASVNSIIEIVGSDLTDDLTVSVAGEGFSCETTTIAKDEAATAILDVVFSSEVVGEFSGTLTISGGGLSEAVVINLTAATVAATGSGTKEDPYTVADVILLNNPKTTSWVKGVIVGYVNGASLSTGAVFDVEGASASNILIADAADVTDAAVCVPIQLVANTDVRANLNLKDNASNLGKELLICGSLEAYFSVAGIKAPSEYVLSDEGGEDPDPTPDPTPELPELTPIDGNLLLNADFESWTDDVLDEWKSTTAAGNATLSKSTDACSGEYAVLIAGSSSNKRLAYKELNLKAGTYTFSFYAKAATADGGSVAPGYVPVVDGKAGSYKYGTYANNLSNTAWTAVSYEFTLDENSVVNLIVMNSKTPGKDVLVDYAGLTTLDGGFVETGDGVIAVEAVSENAPVEVYTLGGVKVGTSLEGLTKGIYIVKQGNSVKKVIK